MTPLWSFYERLLPGRLVWPAVTLTYMIAILLLLLFARVPVEQIIYIDLN